MQHNCNNLINLATENNTFTTNTNAASKAGGSESSGNNSFVFSQFPNEQPAISYGETNPLISLAAAATSTAPLTCTGGFQHSSSSNLNNQEPPVNIRPAKYGIAELLQYPLAQLPSDSEFYHSAIAALMGSIEVNSVHGQTMLAALTVAVLYRCQYGNRQDTLKFTVIDRIREWSGLSRLNASKVTYLSFKIYNHRENQLYIEELGDWWSSLDWQSGQFMTEAGKLLNCWRAHYPRKLSFYQLQTRAAELEKQIRASYCFTHAPMSVDIGNADQAVAVVQSQAVAIGTPPKPVAHHFAPQPAQPQPQQSWASAADMNDLMEAEYRRLQQQQSVPAAASPPPTPSLQQKQHSHSQQFEASKSEKPSLKRPAPDSSAAHYEAEKLKRQAAMQMPFAIQQQYFSLQHQQHFIAANGAVVPVRGYNYRPLFGGSPSSVPPTMERTNSQQNPANIAEQTAGYSQVKKMSIQNLLG